MTSNFPVKKLVALLCSACVITIMMYNKIYSCMNIYHFVIHREKQKWFLPRTLPPPPHTLRVGPPPYTNLPWTPPFPMATSMSPPHLLQQKSLLTPALAPPALRLLPALQWRPAGSSGDGSLMNPSCWNCSIRVTCAELQ